MSRTRAFTVTTADCERQTFRSGGPGGQNQNKRETGVRFIHHPSGARGEAREYRTQGENAKAAWRRMAHSPQFLAWAKVKGDGLAPLEERVAAEMTPDKVKVEVRGPTGWEPEA